MRSHWLVPFVIGSGLLAGAGCSKKQDEPKQTPGSAAPPTTVQPGSGATTEPPPPMPTGSRKVVKIGAGDGAACAVMDNGTVRCWGRNDNGERGTAPSKDDAATPVEVPGVKDAVDIVMGGDSGSSGDIACAITKAQDVWCWGGRQMTPAKQFAPTEVPELKGAVSIALGGGTGYAVKPDGSVWGWGSPAFNTLADGTKGGGSDKPLGAIAGVTGAKQVAAGQNHACALLGDGTVTCWGYSGKQQMPTPVAGVTGATAVFAQTQRELTCAVTNDGTTCWTANSAPAAMPDLAGATSIEGRNHMCALGGDGAVWCWGDNNEMGHLGHAGPTSKPGKVELAKKAVDIAVGHVFSCAVLEDGSAACWGYNQRGQLGDGTLMDRKTPTAVAAISADTLPPASNGLSAVQEGETATSWDGMPDKCKKGALEIVSKAYEGKTFEVKAAKADSQLGGKTITIDLADHNFHRSWGGPRGKQGRLGLRLAKFQIEGDKRTPVNVDLGEYKLGLKEERLVSPSFMMKNGGASLISVSLKGIDAGKLTLTHLDDKWVCGELALASEGSSIKGPFAAPLKQ